MSTVDRWCKDCRHASLCRAHPICLHKASSYVNVDYVQGVRTTMQSLCESMRTPLGECGVMGKLWERRDVER